MKLFRSQWTKSRKVSETCILRFLAGMFGVPLEVDSTIYGLLGSAAGKESACNAWVPSLGWEDPLEEGMATHSSFLA